MLAATNEGCRIWLLLPGSTRANFAVCCETRFAPSGKIVLVWKLVRLFLARACMRLERSRKRKTGKISWILPAPVSLSLVETVFVAPQAPRRSDSEKVLEPVAQFADELVHANGRSGCGALAGELRLRHCSYRNFARAELSKANDAARARRGDSFNQAVDALRRSDSDRKSVV